MKVLDLRIFRMLGLVREHKEMQFPEPPYIIKNVDISTENVNIDSEDKTENE